MKMKKLFLVFLYLVSFFHSAICGCPKSCSCSTTMYDCSKNSGDGRIKVMFNETDDGLQTVDLSNNAITETVVLDGPTLTYLNLANNQLKTLAYDTFDNLDELKTLVLSNNFLSRITDDIFEWNPLKLEVLLVDGNRIEFIQHFLLYDLEQLTELDMHSNLITFIHPHAFLQLKKLRKIRLDDNRLHTFDRKWFKGLQANMFSEINMEKNPWACDCVMKSHAKWLASNKWFTKVAGRGLKCFWPKGQKGKEIKTLKTVKRSELPCDDPDITGISRNTTLYLNQSIELDCVVKGPNEILPVPSIMWIAPNNDHYNLQTADRYEGIEVFQNGSIIIHKMKVDDGGLYKCVASNNKSSVQATTYITVLNRKKPHDENSFKDATRIDSDNEKALVIDVSRCPKGCSCVTRDMDCTADNPDEGLSEIDYEEFPAGYISLSLASNRIRSIPRIPEERFESLLELRLDGNRIEKIASHAFDNAPLLHTLTMRGNRITSLPGKLFRKLSKLTILVLDNNKLTEITDDTLAGLVNLQWLYIRNNLITFISDGAFVATRKIKFIHLEHNQISVLSRSTIQGLTEPKSGTVTIQKIFVEYNRFNCDCRMEPLQNYLMQAKPEWDTLFGDGISCSFPPALDKQELMHLPGQHIPLVCDQTDVKVSSGNMSAMWFGGLILGIIVCGIFFVLWKKRFRKARYKSPSMKYSSVPDYDDAEEDTLLAVGRPNTEAFV